MLVNLIRTEVLPTVNAVRCARYRASLTPEQKEARKRYMKDWYSKHPGYIASANKKWHADNPDRHRELQANWKKTPKGIAAKLVWDRSEKAKEGKAIWRAANPEKVKAIAHRRNHNRRVRVYSGVHEAYDFNEILKLSGNRCAYQLENCLWLQDSYVLLTADHIIPISKGGPDTFENVLPACDSCNKRKGAKLIEPKFRLVTSQQ